MASRIRTNPRPARSCLVLTILTLMLAGCSHSDRAVPPDHLAPSPMPSLTTPVYSGTITIVAREGTRPRCRAPATIRRGTWYWVIQEGNGPVAFTIPGVPGASHPIHRTATYTEVSLYATTAGTYHLVIHPPPARPCAFTIR
jgi:hypothetical protein